jgi:pre-mRNA-splicing factor CDC5/CEF1
MFVKFSIIRLTSLTNIYPQYNADIPFEKKPAPGFYDTSEEQARVAAAPVRQTLRRLENKRKTDADDNERRKWQKRSDPNSKEPGHQTKFIPSREAQQKLKEAESIGRRRKLVLPTAQVGDSELEEIVKIGLGGEEAKALVSGSEASGPLIMRVVCWKAQEWLGCLGRLPSVSCVIFVERIIWITFF